MGSSPRETNNSGNWRDAVERIKDLTSVWSAKLALAELEKHQHDSHFGEKFFADMGHASLQHSDYERAIHAYYAAFTCACESERDSPTVILEKLCKALELSRLPRDEWLQGESPPERNEDNFTGDLECYIKDFEVLLEEVSASDDRITPRFLSKLLIAAGELHLVDTIRGSFETLLGRLEVDHASDQERYIKSLECISVGLAHAERGYWQEAEEYLKEGRENFLDLTQDADSAAIRELLIYVNLALSRLDAAHATLSQSAESANEAFELLEVVDPERQIELPSLVRLVEWNATRAPFEPKFREIHRKLVEKYQAYDLTIYHDIRALVSWTMPATVTDLLGKAASEEERQNIVARCRKEIQRAEELLPDLVGVSAVYKAQLQLSKDHLARTIDGDATQALREAGEAFAIAVREPRAVNVVRERLLEIVWDPEPCVPPEALVEVFQNILECEPRLPAPYMPQSAAVKLQVLAGMVNAWQQAGVPLEAQREVLVPALHRLIEFEAATLPESTGKLFISLSTLQACRVIFERGKQIVDATVGYIDVYDFTTALLHLYTRNSQLCGPFFHCTPGEAPVWCKNAIKIVTLAQSIYESRKMHARLELAKGDERILRGFLADIEKHQSGEAHRPDTERYDLGDNDLGDSAE
jgi:hypothetical protein